MVLCETFLDLEVVYLRSVVALVVVRTLGAGIRANEKYAHSAIIRLLERN